MSAPTRMGDELTKAFLPSLYEHEWQIRTGEDLARSFVELYDHTDSDDEQMRGLFLRADESISALLAEIWKRSCAQDTPKTEEGSPMS